MSKKRYSNAKFDLLRQYFRQSIATFYAPENHKNRDENITSKRGENYGRTLFSFIQTRHRTRHVKRCRTHKNAYFSQGCTTIAYFVVSSCKQGCDALLPIADVLCFSDAIVVQNDANVRCIDDVDFTLFSNGIIGMEVYTQNGILKGKIQKVEFAKGGKVSKLYTENEQFTPQNVACVGDVILLKSAKQGKAKKAVIPRPEKETTVLALKENKKNKLRIYPTKAYLFCKTKRKRLFLVHHKSTSILRPFGSQTRRWQSKLPPIRPIFQAML